MKKFDRIFGVVMAAVLLLAVGFNVYFFAPDNRAGGRPWQVEIGRLALEIADIGAESGNPAGMNPENIDLSAYDYVRHIEPQSSGGREFYDVDSEYAVREINGVLYRFDYSTEVGKQKERTAWTVNLVLLLMSALLFGVLLFVRQKILSPFDKLTDVPYELAKGNLISPIQENKSRFFGRFVWGVNLLRENMEHQKQRELELHKSRKTLLLSLSHDIKTPLAAIKLYAGALSRELYSDREKQREIAGCIKEKADEIDSYVSQIISASREDFLNFEVDMDEFYLSALMSSIKEYYSEKLALIKTEFSVGEFSDCLIRGDIDRSIEIVQNIMENAIKYGDGRAVKITVFEEDGCVLVEIENSGCTLSEAELPHIFESFWRGANSGKVEGSGLGLYICRQLIGKMGGEIFARRDGDFMRVTVVFCEA